MTSPKKICRLCLEVISYDFEILTSSREGMLKIMLLDMDLTLTNTPLICAKCEAALQQAFFFKTSCLSNEDYLKTFLHCDSSIKLTLEEIVQRSIVENEIKGEEESVCRFCFRYFDSVSFVKLANLEEDIFLRDMLYKCLPEINLNITNRPLMCENCLENLQNQFNFVITCTDNDEKIKSYALSNVTNNNDGIDLSDVLRFIDDMRNNDKCIDASLNYIKLENISNDIDGTSCDVDMPKEEFEQIQEDEFHIKMEEDPSSDTETAVQSDKCKELLNITPQLPQKIFTCNICSHKTNRRDSLELHHLIHKDLSKQQLIKCDKCDFKTKWRSSLTQHKLVHINPCDLIKFKCATCPYESKYKKHLRRHCRKHMDCDPRPYQCQYCPWKTSDRWYFKQHNKNKHDKDVPVLKVVYSCKDCQFETLYKADMDKHKKSVHNKMKYICPCGYRSQRLYHLKEHSLMHKSNDEVVMFSCKLCDFTSKYKNSYRTHMRLHEAGKTPQNSRKRGKGKKWESNCTVEEN